MVEKGDKLRVNGYLSIRRFSKSILIWYMPGLVVNFHGRYQQTRESFFEGKKILIEIL